MIPRRIILQRNAQTLSRTLKQSQRLRLLPVQPSLSLNSRLLSTSKPDTPTPPESQPSPQEEAPKPFVAPPAWQRRTPLWLLNSPLFVKGVKGLATMMGHNSKTQTAIRETRTMYQICAEREVKETGFIYVESRLPPTFQTWFMFTNLHVWLLTTRFRALPASHGRVYIQELINHFFLDAEYRLRSVYGPKCPERIIKRTMVDLRDQWSGSTYAYDVAAVTSDAELAAAIWRNVFAARGEKAYKEKDLSEEEREKILEQRRKDNDPEAVVEGSGAEGLEDLPRLLHGYVAHLRREMVRLGQISDEDVIAGRIGKFGRVGSLNHPDTAGLELQGKAIVQSS
ncbi:hypothetical protein M407DRAFT_242942 [Tulasnella calospora MUT 4182]|uniref:Ubiquinol-cytochrome c chaperone domain-containing protein n=1 Tax=Tulasnella calospora MUT 4182 TaxID=1051891 RepID=A0A0C3QNG1_9AGAM|nr:hypothetical protein M407DRAFT_242942 [Tulasnella calospora MUT 4182]